jgi:hypothetical protein
MWRENVGRIGKKYRRGNNCTSFWTKWRGQVVSTFLRTGVCRFPASTAAHNLSWLTIPWFTLNLYSQNV